MMKTLLPYLLLPLLLLCASAPAAAQQQLPEWDQLTPAQRETLIAPVRDRWNSSSPERRLRSYEHARSWQQMTPEQREQARRGMHRFENMSPDQRRDAQALFDKMRGMDKDKVLSAARSSMLSVAPPRPHDAASKCRTAYWPLPDSWLPAT